MNVIPLFKEERKLRNTKKNVEVQLPSEWWTSTYSLDFNSKKDTPSNSPIYKLKQAKKEDLPITPGWTIKKGDYRVKESMPNSHDYVYYRDLKIKLLKYSIYPVVIATMLLVLKFSEILSKV